jgi:hypothetical protein
LRRPRPGGAADVGGNARVFDLDDVLSAIGPYLICKGAALYLYQLDAGFNGKVRQMAVVQLWPVGQVVGGR